MTFDEAFQEIGVVPGSSQEEIRRAYLRLVKARKPEVDPEGFRRLREAYELLRQLPEASPEIRLNPRSVEKRPVRQQAETEEVAAEPADVVRLILQLQAEWQAAEAERIQERFQQRLRSSSRELSLLDDQTAALWQIVQEISGLSADFSMSTRVAISSAVLRGAPGLAIPRLLSQVGEDGDAGWRMAAEIKDLPGLGSLYHDALIEALRNRSWRRRSLVEKPSWSPWKVGGALVGVWLLAQMSTSLFSPSAPVRSLPYPFSYRPPIGSATPPEPAEQAEPAEPVELAEEERRTVCPPGKLDSAGHAVFCQAVQSAFLNLSQRRCHEVREAREELLKALQMMRGSPPEQPARDLFDSLRVEYVTICQDYSF